MSYRQNRKKEETVEARKQQRYTYHIYVPGTWYGTWYRRWWRLRSNIIDSLPFGQPPPSVTLLFITTSRQHRCKGTSSSTYYTHHTHNPHEQVTALLLAGRSGKDPRAKRDGQEKRKSAD